MKGGKEERKEDYATETLCSLEIRGLKNIKHLLSGPLQKVANLALTQSHEGRRRDRMSVFQ